jgi:hypothetical protein
MTTAFPLMENVMDPTTEAGEEPVTIETEVISDELNEEQRNSLADSTVESDESQPPADDAGNADDAKADGAGEKKPKPKGGIKAMPDGTYVLTRDDGSKVQLNESELEGIAQKRIAKATFKQREAERRADEFRARLEQAQGTQDPTPAPNAPPTKADDPRPSWENGDWDSMDQFIDARDAWRERDSARKAGKPATTSDEGSQRQDEQGLDAASQVWLSEAQRVLSEGEEAFGDDWQTYVVKNEAAPFDQEFTKFLFGEVDNPAAMLVELGRDVEKALEIRQMLAEGKTTKAARALGRFEARIDTARGGDSSDDDGPHSDVSETSGDDDGIGRRLEAGRARKASSTPPPPTPLSARGGLSSRKDPEKMNQREYEAWRNEGNG